MAEKKNKGALARIMPHEMVNVDGHDVRVPNGKEENITANKLLACSARSLLEDQIKRYRDEGLRITPKELRDLAEAAKSIADFSATVYNDVEPKKDTRNVTPQALEDIDLGGIASTPEAPKEDNK